MALNSKASKTDMVFLIIFYSLKFGGLTLFVKCIFLWRITP